MTDYGTVPEHRPAEEEEVLLRANILYMALSFSVAHSVCTMPLVVASSLLGANLAYIGNGIFFSAALLSSLLIAAPASSHFGLKGALIFGSSLYCVYIAGFAVALLAGDAALVQWLGWLLASACGGMAGAILWTAQGGYFAETAVTLAALTGQPREAASADLAGTFSFWYLVLEVAAKVSFSVLEEAGMSSIHVVLLFLVLACTAVATLTRVTEVKVDNPSTTAGAVKVFGVISMWRDPVIWLLSFTNLAFGFSSAFMNGYVNRVFLAQELGADAVAMVAAISPLTAATFSKVFGRVASRTGKGTIIAIGACGFLCIPLSLLILSCCDGWGVWMILLYVLQGLGRAVYESTSRSTFADFFPNSATNAFANCALQANFGFVCSYFFQTSLDKMTLATIIVTLAAIMPVGYCLANRRASARTALPA